MIDVLRNPAWYALSTGNANLAQGNNRVKYFDKNVSPFVGLEENTVDHLTELAGMVPDEGISIFISEEQVNVPPEWQVLNCVNCYQLVWQGTTLPPDSAELVIELNESHIPDMVALTQLTNPGPFSAETIRFGYYRGIYADGKLVAMAGQRLNPSPYAEISAVCTHPHHLGKGYAKTLLNHHIRRITAASGIPYLHVKHDNERAINVYKSLGFEISRELLFHVIHKTAK
ncbi:GNAT family N-acetyltransferase [Mucilaginibacter sp. UR6-1]|uniref:GNAT family N-acetyltransferase n=1 Tax=Mucilaginibacter sp. UR6-1 TaxID=1435643 RepID=UPI001E440FA2|nr:GNAT family N-acetyltransferase [Mucilaginibacter sp. UR6-1]MCC8408979.1 GNAT family N-acetyltransferase [Mucilaginibacter sp. UR6-1]